MFCLKKPTTPDKKRNRSILKASAVKFYQEKKLVYNDYNIKTFTQG